MTPESRQPLHYNQGVRHIVEWLALVALFVAWLIVTLHH